MPYQSLGSLLFLLLLLVKLPVAFANPPAVPPPVASLPTANPSVGNPPATQPTTAVAPAAAADAQQSLQEVLNLIEGPNSPQVRRIGARQLLQLRGVETTPRAVAILNSTNAPARIAVATALSELPQFVTEDFLEPLAAMLADPDPAVRQAAIPALTAMPSDLVTPRLRRLVREHDLPTATRLAGISALSQMTSRSAIEALVDLLTDRSPVVASAALEAMEQATATEFNGDAESALAWWQTQRDLPRETWQSRQIARLVRKDRETTRQLQATEARLVKLLRESFQRAGESDRGALLLTFLTDASSAVRLLGLELVISAVEEGRTPAPEVAVQVRALLTAAEPAVCLTAIRTLVALRDADEADRLVELLPTVRYREVRLSLVNALGYLGASRHVAVLRDLLKSTDASLVQEVVTALGRLAERSVLSAADSESLANELVALFDDTPRTDAGLRERLCWAVGFIGHEAGRRILLVALEPTEPAALRITAARSLARLTGPNALDPIIALVSDADPAVRKAAVEVLAAQGSGDRLLTALWTRLAAPQEPEEPIRQLAWRGVVRILAVRPADEIDAWITRLPENGTEQLARTLELLRMLETNLSAQPGERARLATVRLRIAEGLSAAGRPADAVALLLVALPEIATAAPTQTERAAIELVRLSLAAGLFDERIPAALAAADATISARRLWPLLRGELEARLTPALAGALRVDLDRLLRYPPCAWPADLVEEIMALDGQINELLAGTGSTNSHGATRPPGD